LKIEPRDGPDTEHACTQHSADQRPRNADDDGQETAAWVLARHDELGNATGNQAEQNPSEYVHDLIRPGSRKQDPQHLAEVGQGSDN
jgi:hypothetical protein